MTFDPFVDTGGVSVRLRIFIFYIFVRLEQCIKKVHRFRIANWSSMTEQSTEHSGHPRWKCQEKWAAAHEIHMTPPALAGKRVWTVWFLRRGASCTLLARLAYYDKPFSDVRSIINVLPSGNALPFPPLFTSERLLTFSGFHIKPGLNFILLGSLLFRLHLLRSKFHSKLEHKLLIDQSIRRHLIKE